MANGPGARARPRQTGMTIEFFFVDKALETMLAYSPHSSHVFGYFKWSISRRYTPARTPTEEGNDFTFMNPEIAMHDHTSSYRARLFLHFMLVGIFLLVSFDCTDFECLRSHSRSHDAVPWREERRMHCFYGRTRPTPCRIWSL